MILSGSSQLISAVQHYDFANSAICALPTFAITPSPKSQFSQCTPRAIFSPSMCFYTLFIVVLIINRAPG
jgi:hypothetical protein